MFVFSSQALATEAAVQLGKGDFVGSAELPEYKPEYTTWYFTQATAPTKGLWISVHEDCSHLLFRKVGSSLDTDLYDVVLTDLGISFHKTNRSVVHINFADKYVVGRNVILRTGGGSKFVLAVVCLYKLYKAGSEKAQVVPVKILAKGSRVEKLPESMPVDLKCLFDLPNQSPL